jgi:hypothetical protein
VIRRLVAEMADYAFGSNPPCTLIRAPSLQFTACRFASKKSAAFGVNSVFRRGAPRPMKMGVYCFAIAL